jgi:ribosomal protein L29
MVKTEERVLSIEELLSNIHSSKKTMKKYRATDSAEESGAVNNLKHMSKNLPFSMIILLILFAALGTMVIMLKAEVSDLTGTKEQIGVNDSKFRIAIIESKLEATEKENETLKHELSKIKTSLEALRNTNKGGKSIAQR